jgi:hypothetical protein
VRKRDTRKHKTSNGFNVTWENEWKLRKGHLREGLTNKVTCCSNSSDYEGCTEDICIGLDKFGDSQRGMAQMIEVN